MVGYSINWMQHQLDADAELSLKHLEPSQLSVVVEV
jgi:hypothetical protein